MTADTFFATWGQVPMVALMLVAGVPLLGMMVMDLWRAVRRRW